MPEWPTGLVLGFEALILVILAIYNMGNVWLDLFLAGGATILFVEMQFKRFIQPYLERRFPRAFA